MARAQVNMLMYACLPSIDCISSTTNTGTMVSTNVKAICTVRRVILPFSVWLWLLAALSSVGTEMWSSPDWVKSSELALSAASPALLFAFVSSWNVSLGSGLLFGVLLVLAGTSSLETIITTGGDGIFVGLSATVSLFSSTLSSSSAVLGKGCIRVRV